MAEDEKDDKLRDSLPKLSTPALVPWLPPGKPKESTFNAYAHKKNQGSYDLGESKNAGSGFWPAVHKGSVRYNFFEPKLPKRSLQSLTNRKKTLDITKQKRIDSLLNASHNSEAEKEYLRKRILEIFQDSEEGKKVLGELDKEDEEAEKEGKKGRRNSDPTSKSKGGKKKGRSKSYDGDNDSEPYSPRRNNDEGYDSENDAKKRGKKEKKNSKSDKNTGSANTETSGVGSTDDDLDERNSIEFIDFDSQTDGSPRRKNNRQGGNNNGSYGNNGQVGSLNLLPGHGQNFQQQYPGQNFPGQNYPGNFDGQGYQNGQNFQGGVPNFPGQPFPNPNFPGQNFPGQGFNAQQSYNSQYSRHYVNGQGYPGPMYNGQNSLGTNGYIDQGYQGLNYANQGPQLNSFDAKNSQLMNQQGKHSQSDGQFYDSGDDYFLSPTPADFQSIQLDRSRQSRLSQRGLNAQEAWVIFPKNGASPRRSIQSRQAFTARPLNYANSIGSRLKQSFAQINRSSTPIGSTSGSIDPLIEEMSESEKAAQKKKKRKNALIAGGAACCATVVLASILILALIFATRDSSSSNLESTDFYQGFGNNNDTRPCVSYTALTDRWRRIVGFGPLTSGGPYYCDKPRYSQNLNGITEGWYRFQGEAGTHLATQSPGAFAPGAGTLKEVCGTSYVGWMNGQHPKIHEGIVTRDFCFEWESGTCQYGFKSYVRTCPDTTAGPSDTYYVYYLKLPRDIQCNFGYCAEA